MNRKSVFSVSHSVVKKATVRAMRNRCIYTILGHVSDSDYSRGNFDDLGFIQISETIGSKGVTYRAPSVKTTVSGFRDMMALMWTNSTLLGHLNSWNVRVSQLGRTAESPYLLQKRGVIVPRSRR